MNEQWVDWKPIDNLPKEYEIESVKKKQRQFQIIFYDLDKEYRKVLIDFADSLVAYRCADETYRLQTIEYIYRQREQAGIQEAGYWFKVFNSSYISSLLSEMSTDADLSCMHFCFFTYNYILDVVAFHEPKITFHEAKNV